MVPVSWSLDTMGWMARSVEDAALMLQVTAGPDGNDPICARFPAADYLSGLEDGAAPRISLITSFFMEESSEEVQRHTRDMLDRLAAAGAEVDEVKLPESFSTAIEDQLIIMRCEAAAFHRPMYETRSEEYRPLLRRLIARGLETTAVEYSGALERRLQFITDMQVLAENADVLPHADYAHARAGRPQQHRHHRLPRALDLLRPAHHHHTVGPGRIRPAHGTPDYRRALPRRTAPGRRPLVRASPRRSSLAAGVNTPSP